MPNITCATVFAMVVVGTPFHVLAKAPHAVPPAPDQSRSRPLRLAEAYVLATKNNPTLQAMDARVRQAQAETRRAWAQIQPTAGVSGSYTFTDPEVSFDPSEFAPPGTVGTGPIVIQKRLQFGFDAQAALPIFRGPAYHRIGIAKKGVQAAQLRLQHTRRDFMLRVADAYYRALGLTETITALAEQVSVDRDNVAIVRTRLEAGSVLPSELARAELVLVQDQQALLQQRNALRAAKQRIAILIGLPNADIELERPPEPKSPLTSTSAMIDVAQRKRADLKALSVDIAAAKQTKTAAWWSFLPGLDLSFAYNWKEASGFVGRKDSYTLVGTLSFPLYEGGLRYADLHSAAAQIAASVATKAERARDIAEQIAELRAELLSAETGLVAADKAVSLAKLSAEEMSARYEAGSTTQLDLLDANQRYLEARIELTQRHYGRDMARLALARAMGLDIQSGD